MNHVFQHNGVIHGEAACLYILGQPCKIQNMLCTFASRKKCKEFLTSIIKFTSNNDFYLSFNKIDRQWDLILNDIHYTVCTHIHKPKPMFDIDTITLASTTLVKYGQHNTDTHAVLLHLLHYKFAMLPQANNNFEDIAKCVIRTQYMHDRGWKILDKPYHLKSTWRIASWSMELEKFSCPHHTTCPSCGEGFDYDQLIVHFCLTHLNIHSGCFVRMFL